MRGRRLVFANRGNWVGIRVRRALGVGASRTGVMITAGITIPLVARPMCIARSVAVVVARAALVATAMARVTWLVVVAGVALRAVAARMAGCAVDGCTTVITRTMTVAVTWFASRRTREDKQRRDQR